MTDRDRPRLVDIGGTPLWTQEVHGVGGNNPLFDPGGRALFVSDGWGNRPAPALRFRRLDLATGTETANWPCGSTVRCFVELDGGDMLVATDQRLARLDALTLTERARWNRSVRHATTLAVRGGVAVAGNPALPTITLVDLGTGAVRRKRHGSVVAILGRRDGDPVLVGGSSGGLATIDPATGAIRKLRPAPAAMAAALAHDQQGVWLVAGIRVVRTEHDGGVSLRPGDAVTRVEWHPLGEGEPRIVDVPLPVRTIAAGAGSIWLTARPTAGSPEYLVIGETGGRWRIWRPPDEHVIHVVAPVLGLAVTTPRRAAPITGRSAFTCHRIATHDAAGGGSDQAGFADFRSS
jgi:hypothetical protein